jgi:hypothetical protein
VFHKDGPPIHGWAGGGYLAASSFEFYETDERLDLGPGRYYEADKL